MTTRIGWALALVLAGCRTGEPSTAPDDATSPGQPDDDAMPDDEEPEDEEPY